MSASPLREAKLSAYGRINLNCTKVLGIYHASKDAKVREHALSILCTFLPSREITLRTPKPRLELVK